MAELFLNTSDDYAGQAGIVAPTPGPWWIGGQAVALAAQRAYLLRFFPLRSMRIVRISLLVRVAATVDDPVEVGIYDASGARVVTSGSTTGMLNALGVRGPTIAATTLKARSPYYAAFLCPTIGGTAAQIHGVSTGNNSAVYGFGSTIGTVEGDLQNALASLPATWPAIGGSMGNGPIMWLRET